MCAVAAVLRRCDGRHVKICGVRAWRKTSCLQKKLRAQRRAQLWLDLTNALLELPAVDGAHLAKPSSELADLWPDFGSDAVQNNVCFRVQLA